MTKTGFQTTEMRPARLDRGHHVWRKREDGSWKCMLCGGIAGPDGPTLNDLPSRFERLSAEELGACPPTGKKDPGARDAVKKH